MVHPDTEIRFINSTIGYGLFATKKILEGTIVYVKDELEIMISPEDYKKYSEHLKKYIDRYSYIDPEGYRILSWDLAKYTNHCCDPNTISTGYGFEFAIKDIEPGEQITDEYGIFNLDRILEVSCDKQNCRKFIKPDDFETYYEEWDEKIKESLPKIFIVEQPLYVFLDNETKRELEEFRKDPKKYKTVYNLRYKKKLDIKRIQGF
ncbi:MAG: SET domain-containing protein [Leptonema sp. (in: bacteria)]